MAVVYVTHLSVCLWIVMFSYTECFVVTPKSTEVTTQEGEDSVFNYIISPWPPPYKDEPGGQEYELVEISFWDELEGVPGVELCRVRFDKGVYDVNTGNCSLWDGRMLPYDPATPNGVYFSFVSTEWDDRGQYGLLVEYGDPDIHTPVQLKVHVAPTSPNITTDPDKADFNEGEEVALICKIKNVDPPADLEWTRGMFDVIHPNPEDYNKATGYYEYSNSTIRFQAKPADHGQAYVCSAYVDVNTQQYTSSIALSVLFKPSVSLSPCSGTESSYFVIEGKTARFTCDVSANPHHQDITWFHKLDESSDFIELINEKDTTLYLSDVLRNISGHVKCSTSNNLGSGDGLCHLDVQYGPEVHIPDMISIQEFSKLELECKAESNPPPDKYRWLKEGDSSFIQYGSLLNISSLTAEAAGVYICWSSATLTPTDGTPQTHTDMKPIQVNALYKPRLHQFALTKFAGRVSEPIVIVCDVQAFPNVTSITWSLNSEVITSNQYRNVSRDGNFGFVHIYNVGDPDFGMYECFPKNEQGYGSILLYLLHPGIPAPPQNCTIYNITDYYTTLACIPGYDGGEEQGSYVLAEDVNGERKKVSSSVTWTPDRSHMIIHVNDLEPESEYNLHVFGENGHGRSESFLNVKVQTIDGPGNPTPPPQEGGASVGLIIGSTIALLVLVALLVGVGILALWRYGVEPSCARTAQEKANVPYSTLIKRDKLADKGFQNEGFEAGSRTSALPQDYTNLSGVNTSIALSDMDTDNKLNQAYEQRKAQSNLAGMGALSYNSSQNIPTTVLQVHQTNQRPPPPPGNRPPTIGGSTQPSTDRWEYPRDQLTIRQKLGEGAFGEVWKGTAVGIAGREGQIMVAVKMLSVGSPKEEIIAIKKELSMMKSLRPHPNVISLLGCCTEQEPLYIILEFAEHGNLQSFLRDMRSDVDYEEIQASDECLTTRGCIMMALHVTAGMEYITSHGYIHRDLAARNVLVDSSLICKICDFGLARDVINSRTYESKSQRRLPIRWMAPESLFDSIYTIQSDVWSFGVLLWEILTLGSTPYPGLSGAEIMQMIQTGYRMDKPQNCTRQMYEIMRNCWEEKPQRRPDFSSLKDALESAVWDLHTHPQSDLRLDQIHANQFRILNGQPGEKC